MVGSAEPHAPGSLTACQRPKVATSAEPSKHRRQEIGPWSGKEVEVMMMVPLYLRLKPPLKLRLKR